MVGLFEPVCAPWKVEGVPQDFSFGELRRIGTDTPFSSARCRAWRSQTEVE